jgi:ribosome biogenesis GTPase / thiamine phosphate phosphatase
MATSAPTTLVELGWDPGWAAAFLPYDAAGWSPARVVVAHRDAWRLATVAGDRDAVISGRLRHEAAGPGDLPAVGDWVAVTGTAADATTVIQAVLPRRAAFTRNTGGDTATLLGEQVMAANVDVVFVVAGLDGDFNLRRLERYLAVAWAGGSTPVLLLNKADVAADVEGLRVAAEAVAPGVEVRTLSALTGDGVAELAADHLPPGRTAVVLGSSGVGKSTLVNALVGEDRLATGAVRDDDSRGRHTTTHRELVRLPGGALLIDTPGIRSLGVAGAAAGIEDAFADIAELAAGCRFGDCSHDSEPGCNVKAALADGRLDRERLASQRKLEREAMRVAMANDPLLRAVERRKWRAIHVSVSQHMQRKYGSDR